MNFSNLSFFDEHYTTDDAGNAITDSSCGGIEAYAVLAGMEMARYREQEFMLEPGDKLFAYTDGVSEATDALNELYGRDRILNVLNGAAGYTTTETVHKMKEDVDVFVGEAPQFDDITMLCLQYQKEN